ncbi:hypothetical protein, partial [Enteractinococcus coprophilus]|uniref:helix-turn-helix transcriptional regulator n=2 Tax=Actinomycetes TaxID=1760 RepID=UPI0031E00B38
MSKRPEFPIAQITEQFEISRSTLRRGLNDGRFPNAKKDHHGRWLIPVDDVLQAGFKPRKTWLNDIAHESGSQGGHDSGSLAQNGVSTNENKGSNELAQLEKELAHERAQVEKFKALLEAEQNHVESLRMALRMIESGKTTTSLTSSDFPTQDSESEQNIEAHPVSSTRRSSRLIDRLFRR